MPVTWTPSLKTILALTALVAGGALAGGRTGAAQPPPSQAQAQPAIRVLERVCLKCHNGATRAGGIDLSTAGSAKQAQIFAVGGSRGRLVAAVESGKMPPDGRLPAADVEALKRWVAQGAAYPDRPLAYRPAQIHLWSLSPVRTPAVPTTPWDRLSANPIDRFVFAGLAKAGLKPSPPADRRTLLRRVTIDLTGLPPTPGEIRAFLRDRSANAYERVVDRLLTSPAYGERWARHWLDVVRYGESNGYEQNHLRPNAWPYRDYVISAFNRDVPYPRFVAEQLAGDVLANGDPNVAAATGFLVAGVHDTVGIQTEEGTRQQRANDLDDMASTTCAAFLALTVNCARCHDHKFDPIPQRDYYRLVAVFAGVRHGERDLPRRTLTPARETALQAANARIFSDVNAINALDLAARARIQATAAANSAASRPAVNARRNVDDFAPTPARYVRFTVLGTNDGTEPCLDELQVYGSDASRDLALSCSGATAAASSLLPNVPIHQIAHLNDGRFGNEWSWISAAPGAGWAQIELPRAETISRVVWSRDGSDIPRFDDRLPTRYRIEVSLDGATWRTVSTDAGRAGSQAYIHPDVLAQAMTSGERDERAALLREVGDLRSSAEQWTGTVTAYAGQFTPPDPTYFLTRGDVMLRGDREAPGALSCVRSLSPDLAAVLDPEPSRRLALAHWIASPQNPLTARVLVNRLWQHHFGQGIVGTPSDFGNNGEKPTHPSLLDWLASRFMAGGWRIKELQRLMVTSYCYRQRSAPNARARA